MELEIPADALGEIPIAFDCRDAEAADLGDFFANYDGSFRPVEDGFASPAGEEEM